MKRYTVVFTEDQRKLIHAALSGHELSYAQRQQAQKLAKRLETVPISEREHQGITHVLS